MSDVAPFEAFIPVFKILTLAGLYKLNNPKKRWKIILYAVYKRLALLIVLGYDAQYFLYSLQPEKNKDELVGSLVFLLPLQNVLIKGFNMFFHLPRIENVNGFLKGGDFNANSDETKKILLEHVKDMHRLCKLLVTYNVTIGAILWIINSIVKRFVNGENDVVPMYLPYRTDTIFGFCMLILNQVGPLLWMGYGHLSMDALMTTYFAHAHTQLKIIKHQLNTLLEVGNHNDEDYLKYNFVYKDLTNTEMKLKFVMIVQRYDKLVWYVNEVTSIFDFPISMQFFTSCAAVCFIVYSMTKVSILTVPFVFMMVLMLIFLTPTFLYCFAGNFIYIESMTVNDALYNSDWLSLSPSFRRLLLIAMVRWSRPLQPRVCGIINLSLTTFISIVKSSYTLYTVLITTGNVNNE